MLLADATGPVEAILIIPRHVKLLRDQRIKGVHRGQIAEKAGIENRIKKQKGMQMAYLIDEKGDVGRMYGAKTTPHMYVIDPEGKLVYAGGIDDKKSTSVADIAGATNYVSECLDAALAGKPIEVKTSTPYGCAIKYAKK